jgi:putative transposase
MDSLHERLENGRAYRVLAVLDCFTRELLLLKAGIHYPGSAVQRDLEWLLMVHGRPRRIRFDNGPEFRSQALGESLQGHGVEAGSIELGSPWENGHIESFFGKLRDELLNREVFPTGADLNPHLADFQDHYNNKRPQSALAGQTPAAYKNMIKIHKEDGTLTT